MEFIEAPFFTENLPSYSGADDFRERQLHLARDPEAGDVVSGTGGFRKLGWPDRRRGKGKRGCTNGRSAIACVGSEPMAEKRKRTSGVAKRTLFREPMSGVQAMRAHRERRVTLRTHHVEPIAVPPIDPDFVRGTREALHMSRRAFAFKIGVNPRTLERWEQGRSKPNQQAAVLLWLVRRYPNTLERLESVAVPA